MDSEIKSVLDSLAGTEEAEILEQMETIYKSIDEAQKKWYEKSAFYCVDGCGECCRDFEPDLLDSEALYMAAWLMENQPEIAENVARGQFPFSQNKGCQFWNENAKYHCSIYGGRALVCRLFGACGNKSKNGETVWKPCKFYPVENLARHKPPLTHRQYSQKEIEKLFGILPPVMGNFGEEAASINTESEKTLLVRDVLPETIQKLLWIRSMNLENKDKGK